MKLLSRAIRAAFVAFLSLATASAQEYAGFVSLFDGSTLKGWKEIHRRRGAYYFVTNGVIVAPPGTANNLVTERAFSDFILRLDFRLTAGANNGIGIRVPLDEQSPAGYGNEIQILDDPDPQYAHLEAGQYCGSFYKVFPARRGALNRVGQWNHYEITTLGRKLKIVLNGQIIVDDNVNTITNREILMSHPNMLRTKGRIALLGHWSRVEFRNIFIKELPSAEQDNTPPAGFVALFDGHDLDGWRGRHWKIHDGSMVSDGGGGKLRTKSNYGDFELLADWKSTSESKAAIYLRGPSRVSLDEAGNPGQWNRLRILAVGNMAHVFVNEHLVVNDATMENFFNPGKPIPAEGPIRLETSAGTVAVRNIYIRSIPPNAGKY